MKHKDNGQQQPSGQPGSNEPMSHNTLPNDNNNAGGSNFNGTPFTDNGGATPTNMPYGIVGQPSGNLTTLANTKPGAGTVISNGAGTNGNVTGQSALPQTGNSTAEAASAVALGLMGVALAGLGATKKRHA